jgi:hypothetical protein
MNSITLLDRGLTSKTAHFQPLFLAGWCSGSTIAASHQNSRKLGDATSTALHGQGQDKLNMQTGSAEGRCAASRYISLAREPGPRTKIS